MHDLPPSSDSRKLPSGPGQPYLEWALETRFSYLREGHWIPLLIQFNPEVARRSSGNDKLTALEAFATRLWLHDSPRTLDDKFIIPALFSKTPKLLEKAADFDFCIGLIRRDPNVVRELITANGWKRTIVRLELGPPVSVTTKGPPAPPPTQRAAPREVGIGSAAKAATTAAIEWIKANLFRANRTEASAGGGSASTVGRVVIAVIDQGMAFANSRFFDGGATRIEYLWQQNMLGAAVPTPAQTMPFTPGFELDKLAIQNAFAAAKAVGAGEDWVYQNFGGLAFGADSYKPLAHRKTHGTHVLDLAAGEINSNQHPIIAVDMPEDAVGDPAGSTLSVQAAWGLIYVLDRAARLRGPNETLPVVANLSYGPHDGPHDGTSIFENFMDKIWQLADGSDTPLEIVLAAGNFRQTRTHAAFDLKPKKRKSLRWRLQPGSLSASQMEIWLPPGSGHQVTLTLRPPITSAALPQLQVSTQAGNVILSAGNALCSARYVPAAGAIKADSIVLNIARTAPDPDGTWGDALAPSGVWLVTIGSKSAINGLSAWIKRSGTLSGRRAKGRQSYFDDLGYPRYWPNGRPYDFDPPTSTSYVRRIQTLSGIATGDKTRVIGGYRNSDLYPASYSSHGTRSVGGVLTGPDWLECSDESDVLLGVLAAGTRSGSVVAMNGTSVAAPQATRWIAQAWLGLTKGNRPPVRAGLRAPNIPPQRPIPPADLAAIGNRLATFAPRRRRR